MVIPCYLLAVTVNKLSGWKLLYNNYTFPFLSRPMSVFTQKFNPITGKNEWTMQNEDYDFHQEVARSSYADMLHDKERNQKYYDAIKAAVKTMKDKGRSVKVLDIGTGTGLLAMMAARSGADKVIACEAFFPVAKCALQVIKDNGFEGRIKIIPKRSTELTVGSGGDMEEKANILVTEVFDTELIGEGALGTFSHALQHLLEKDCIVVPYSATVYAQVIQSDLVLRWNKLKSLYIDESTSVIPPEEVTHCSGAAAVHDIQMAQLTEKDFTAITKPVPVFKFDFTGRRPLKMEGMSTTSVKALCNGQCQAVFLWWDLQMDLKEDIILSCAPPWAHTDPANIQWRDHWMQAVYYMPKTLDVAENDVFKLHAYHDEYSLWFSALRSSDCLSETIPRPVCTCGAHVAYSRTRLGMLNDPVRNKNYLIGLKKILTPGSVCLSLGDGSFLPVIAAKLGVKKVYIVESQQLSKKVVQSYIKANFVSEVITVLGKRVEDLTDDDIDGQKVDVLLAEPFFNTCLLPWDTLHYWYQRSVVSPLLSPSVTFLLHKAIIKGVAVEFQNLWKIRSPVQKTQGFNVSAFDRMVQQAMVISDASVEPHPLWEYPCVALTSTFELLSFDVTGVVISTPCEATGLEKFLSEGVCNGVALWMDYQLHNGSVITTGPVTSVQPGKQIQWDRYSRQGVYFMTDYASMQGSCHHKVLQYSAVFNPHEGHLDFTFTIKYK